MPLVELSNIDNGAAVITLNDPNRLNPMNEEMASEFRGVVNCLRDNTEVRAVVVTGAGRAFSAGGDVRMLRSLAKDSPGKAEHRMREFYASYLSILDLQIPLIAAINGDAVGAGFALALPRLPRSASVPARARRLEQPGPVWAAARGMLMW